MSKKPNKKAQRTAAQQRPFELRSIKPLNANQNRAFRSYDEGKNIILHGYAGTGKTFIALYKALEEILTGTSDYDRIAVIRSVVPSRDMGFLPGSIKDKIAVYEEPYKEICDDLFGRGDGYDILKMKKLVNFTTTSYLRGLTFKNTIVIVDEVQNMSFGEIDTIMTRMGDYSRIIICGDYRQTDLNKAEDHRGLQTFLNITKRMNSFDFVEFERADIVRSGLVKEYIITKTEMNP